MNNLKKYIQQFENIDTIPAYLERLENVTCYLQCKKEIGRSTAAPKYVTDLGIRKLESPKLLYSYICNTEKIAYKFSEQDIVDDIAVTPIADLAYILDAFVLLTGEYEFIAKAIMTRYTEILSSTDYWLLVYSATILGAVENSNALQLFLQAKKYEPDDQFLITNHRLAAYSLKRTTDSIQFYKCIDELFFTPEGSEDKLVALALMDNLFPLSILDGECSEREYASAYLLLNSALAMCNLIIGGEYTDEVKSRVARYRSQICINIAQILSKQQLYENAVAVLKNNISLVKKDSPEYLGEAYATYQYSLHLSGKFEDAIIYGEKACTFFTQIGDMKAKITSLEILATSYASLGQVDIAEEIIIKIEGLK